MWTLVLSRLDCNRLFVDLFDRLIDMFQGAENNGTRIVFRKPGADHVTPLLFDRRWLRARARIEFKMAIYLTSCCSRLRPNLSELVLPAWQVSLLYPRPFLTVPRIGLGRFDRRPFFSGPSIWNDLPLVLRTMGTTHTFRSGLSEIPKLIGLPFPNLTPSCFWQCSLFMCHALL